MQCALHRTSQNVVMNFVSLEIVEFLSQPKKKLRKHGTEGQVNRMNVSKCDFCRYRHSWDCDDGLPYPENGCESFTLDKSTLSDDEQRMLVLGEILRGDKNG